MPISKSEPSMSLVREQVLVFAGMAGATLLLFALWQSGFAASFFKPAADDTAARLALAVRWLLLPALCLLVGIGAVANRRFFSADAIDGSRTPSSRSLEVNLRYNQNTLEQVVLASIAWLGLALALPREQLSIIPALAIVFAAGRVLFWIGYLMSSWARALGFSLTFYPTVVAYVWLISRALSGRP